MWPETWGQEGKRFYPGISFERVMLFLHCRSSNVSPFCVKRYSLGNIIAVHAVEKICQVQII